MIIGAVASLILPAAGTADASAAAQWAVQPTPSPGTGSGLDAVSCAAEDSCLAVGAHNTRDSTTPLAERWDGSTWTIIKTPPRPAGQKFIELDAVACVAAYSCTAVGKGEAGYGSALAEHWNGSSWALQDIKSPPRLGTGVFYVELNAISCTAADTCTAVGETHTSAPVMGKMLAERLSGGTWTRQPTRPGLADLNGISCVSADNCTAVGAVAAGALAAYWNGTTWNRQTTPSVNGSSFSSVAWPSASNCTAAGVSGTAGFDAAAPDRAQITANDRQAWG